MKIGVCGIACEKCPRMMKEACPSGEGGCRPKMNPFCKISTCAYNKKVSICFECPEFPCETTKEGPIDYDYCRFLVGTGT
ncbi:MAG: DUF3795 domain-containing protein [Candidatus Bathyarchaeia archaeon]